MNETVEVLRKKRSDVLARRTARLTAAVKANRGLTVRERAEDDALAAEVRVLGDVLSRAEEVERTLASGPSRIEVRTPARPKGWTMASCILSLAASGRAKVTGTPLTPAQFAEGQLHDFQAASALSASTVSGGGGMIREDVSADFIEGLYPRTCVRAAGARVENMPLGNLDLNRVTTGPVTTWIGEQSVSKGTAAQFGQSRLAAKKLRALVPISNDLIRFAGERAIANVREDVLRAMAAAEDAAFIRGTGTEYTPAGLSKQAGGTAASSSSPTIKSVDIETGTAILALLAANSRMISPGWLWNPRTTLALGSQRSPALGAADGLGVKAWPEIGNGMFRGYPFLDTTAIPINLGTGSDSEIYFADFADVVVAQGPLLVRPSSQASYTDSAGNSQSAFSRDETLIDVIESVDLGVRHTGSVYLLTAVEYALPS